MDSPTEKDTYDHIIGSGCLSYPWFTQVESSSAPLDVTSEDPQDYVGWWVRWLDVDSGKRLEVNHALILKAMRSMMQAEGKRPEYVSDSAARECRHFLFDRDDTDFDSCTADEVMQVSVFGKVIYS